MSYTTILGDQVPIGRAGPRIAAEQWSAPEYLYIDRYYIAVFLNYDRNEDFVHSVKGGHPSAYRLFHPTPSHV